MWNSGCPPPPPAVYLWRYNTLCCTNNIIIMLHLGHMCSYEWICWCVWLCLLVCMCVSLCVDGAFVTKHPRCQRDTVGWWREGWGPSEEVFLYCCTAVETVAPSLSFSYSRLFSGIYNRPGGGLHSIHFNKERGSERSEGVLRGKVEEAVHSFHMFLSLFACAARMGP